MSLEIVYKQTSELTPYAKNARTHSDAQIKQIAESIQEFGFNNPVLLDGENGIIAGHGRAMAAEILKMDQVPTIELSHLNEQQKRAYILADNKLALNAGWDDAMLGIELADLQAHGGNVDLIGFSEKELDALMNPAVVTTGLIDDDEIPEPATNGSQSVARAGEVWTLGRHRLMCGSSTEAGDIAKLMEKDQADIVWTDPPYNVDYHGADGQSIQNDNMTDAKFKQFLLDAFKSAFDHTKPGGCIYIAHADTYGHTFRTAMIDSGFMLKQCLIWIKNAAVMGRQDYNWKHEPILYGWKPGAAHYFCDDFSQNTVIDDDIDISKLDKAELKNLINTMRQAEPTTIIRENKPHRNDMHPTMKPVALVERMLINSSRPGQTVLDLFGGSGTTLIASEKNARCARIMELDEKYCDVILTRWQDFTGNSAMLGSRTFNEVKNERQKTTTNTAKAG